MRYDLLDLRLVVLVVDEGSITGGAARLPLSRLEGAVAGYTHACRTVRLVAGSSPMQRLVPRAMVTFLSAHPDVDVVAVERRSGRPPARVSCGAYSRRSTAVTLPSTVASSPGMGS